MSLIRVRMVIIVVVVVILVPVTAVALLLECEIMTTRLVTRRAIEDGWTIISTLLRSEGGRKIATMEANCGDGVAQTIMLLLLLLQAMMRMSRKRL